MKIKILLFIWFTVSVTIFESCNKHKSYFPNNKFKVPKIEEVLNGKDQNLIELLHKVRGSVGRRGSGSKTIWSRKNDYELGLYLSANHVYNITGWSSRNSQIFDLSNENLGIFETSQIPPENGNIILGNTLIADFPLMHFSISPSVTNNTILPEEDFYLGIVDNQRVEQSPLAKYPEIVQKSNPLKLYDPENRTKATQTWNIPIYGQKAIAVGYPQDRTNYPNGAVAYGKIVSDAEARNIMLKLKEAGDSEGDISYNSTVEFLIEAEALPGMSGGGVFNSEGQLLGIMVRASNEVDAPKIIRVVKITHIKSKLIEFYNSLSESDKKKMRVFISGEL